MQPNSSDVSFPGKKASRGPFLPDVEKDEKSCARKCKVKGRTEDSVARTEQKSEKSERLVDAAENSKELAEWHRLQKKSCR